MYLLTNLSLACFRSLPFVHTFPGAIIINWVGRVSSRRLAPTQLAVSSLRFVIYGCDYFAPIVSVVVGHIIVRGIIILQLV